MRKISSARATAIFSRGDEGRHGYGALAPAAASWMRAHALKELVAREDGLASGANRPEGERTFCSFVLVTSRG